MAKTDGRIPSVKRVTKKGAAARARQLPEPDDIPTTGSPATEGGSRDDSGRVAYVDCEGVEPREEV